MKRLMLPSVPDIRDDDSTHSNATYSDKNSEDFVHADEKVVQPNEDPTSKLQQIPKWEQSTLNAVGFEEDSISACGSFSCTFIF